MEGAVFVRVLVVENLRREEPQVIEALEGGVGDLGVGSEQLLFLTGLIKSDRDGLFTVLHARASLASAMEFALLELVHSLLDLHA